MELPLEGVSESAESWPLILLGKVSNVPMALPCSVAVKREEGLGAMAMGAVLGTAAVELDMAGKRRGEAKGGKRQQQWRKRERQLRWGPVSLPTDGCQAHTVLSPDLRDMRLRPRLWLGATEERDVMKASRPGCANVAPRGMGYGRRQQREARVHCTAKRRQRHRQRGTARARARQRDARRGGPGPCWSFGLGQAPSEVAVVWERANSGDKGRRRCRKLPTAVCR